MSRRVGRTTSGSSIVQRSALLTEAAVNSGAQVSLRDAVFTSLGETLGGGIAGS